MKQSVLKRFLVLVLTSIIVFSSSISAAAVNERAVLKTEDEPNNTFSYANTVNQDDTMLGTINSTYDVDYYRVTFPLSGSANFWLGEIPSGADYDLYVYNSSYVLLGSSTGTSSSELVTLSSVSANTTYYFKVKGHNGSYNTTSQYRVRCRLILGTYNYFCQNTPSSSIPNYSTNNLDILYYYENGVQSSYSFLSKIKSGGCVACSYAMVLRNLGATTSNHYDIRTGTTGPLLADPFTVTYSNTQFPSITQVNGVYIANCGNPVWIDDTNTTSGFGKTFSEYNIGNLSSSAKADAIAYQLSLHPEGIIVSFKLNAKRHTIVFVATTHETPLTYTFPLYSTIEGQVFNMCEFESSDDCLNEESIHAWEQAYLAKTPSACVSSYDTEFTVCDPCSTTLAPGNQVLFSNCYTQNEYGFSSAYLIRVVND